MKKHDKRGDKGDSSPCPITKPPSNPGLASPTKPSRINSSHQLNFPTSKVSPIKSALEELEDNINNLSSVNDNLEKDLKDASERALFVMESCENNFLQQLSSLQGDVIDQCKLAEEALQVEYNSALDKIIQKKQIQTIPKMNESEDDNMQLLNSDFYVTTSMAGIDEELKGFVSKGLMEDEDLKSIVESLKQLMETTANTSDCKLLKGMLIKLESDFTPRSELNRAEEMLEEIKSKIVPKATFFTLQRSLENLKDKWKTLIEDNKKIYSFRENLLKFEKVIKAVDNKYKKLESGLNIFAAESCLKKTPLETIRDVLNTSFEEYLLTDLPKNELFKEILQDAVYIEERLKLLECTFASEDELQGITKMIKGKTLAQEDVKRFSNRIKDVESNLGKILSRNINEDYNKINTLLRTSATNKTVGALVKTAQDRITDMGNEIQITLTSAKQDIQISLNKQIESAKADVLAECLPFAKDRVIACFEALRNDLEPFGVTGMGYLKTEAVREGLAAEKKNWKIIFEEKMQASAKDIKKRMSQQLTALAAEMKSHCHNIQEKYVEDYKILCQSIQDDLNENLQRANGNLLANFQTLLDGCDTFHLSLRNEVEEMLEVLNQEACHLKNLKILATEGGEGKQNSTTPGIA